MKDKQILIVGSYASEYSLARVNRGLGFALKDFQHDYQVAFYAQEEFIDRIPNANDLGKYPQLKTMQTSSQDQSRFAIFNNFPKSANSPYNLAHLTAPIKVGYLGWEESIFPKKFVDECNQHLQGMMVLSNHVLRVFRNSGLKIPIINVGVGINQDLPKLKDYYPIATKKKYKFLHISSAHYRKGVDVLLRAYFAKFTAQDNVSLIIKLFPNPDSELQDLLTELKTENSPEVVVINDPDLSEGEIASIIKQSHCLVAPSRAEGFGIPLAEAMLLKIPLITTNYSGQTDFCKQDNCYLLDYHMVNSASQLFNPGAKLAEPDHEQLGELMRSLYDRGFSAAETKNKLAKAYITAQELTWENTCSKVSEFLKYLERIAALKQQKLAVISTRNSVCGIADYTQHFYPLVESSFKDVHYFANTDAGDRVFPDSDNVLRTWEYGESDFSKTIDAIRQFKPDYVHIQYNPPFYSLEVLGILIKELVQQRIKVYLTIHSLGHGLDFARYKSDLQTCSKIFVHSQSDLQILTKKGYKNIHFWPHGIKEFPEADKTKVRSQLGLTSYQPIIASHGMIHDKKGLLELISAVKLLTAKYPNILCLSVNALNQNNITSSATFQKMQNLVKELQLENNVLLLTEFLANAEIVRLLQVADLVALPYSVDLKEGASGAVRTSMAALKPVIVTESYIFSELKPGYRIKNNDPKLIAKAIERLLTDHDLAAKEVAEIRVFLTENSWEKISRNYLLELAG